MKNYSENSFTPLMQLVEHANDAIEIVLNVDNKKGKSSHCTP